VTNTLRTEKLRRTHAVESFDCGQPALDRFLARHAMQAQQAGSSLIYVALSEEAVIGYYSLIFGEARHADAPERVVKGMPRHPIPLMVLARLPSTRKTRPPHPFTGISVLCPRRPTRGVCSC
jgi:hypothetical protein